MSDPIDALILDFLEWVAKDERPYAEAMEAWRTSCPRLPVWEEAQDRGLIARRYDPASGPRVEVTDKGRELLKSWLSSPAS